MAVDDEVRLPPALGAGVVVEAAVTDRAHPEGAGAGDVGAAQVADVDGLCGPRVERG